MVVIWLNSAAKADEPAFSTSGDLRWIGSALTDFPVDAEGTTLGQQTWLDQRIRLGAAADLGDVALGTQWDLFTGQLAGDTWDITGSVDARRRDEHGALGIDGVRPRRISMADTAGAWSLEAGLVPSGWGLGMVANAGAEDPVFGRADFGDRVVRLRATHGAQGGLFVTGAADLVVQDDIASLTDHQLAFQGIFSTLSVRPNRQLGMYVVLRHQLEADRTRFTQAGVVDGYGRVHEKLASGWGLHGAGEVAGILGRTDRGTTYAAREMVGVASLGATGEVGLDTPSGKAGVDLRAGYASGDGHPSDGINHDFTFDRDFGVGMVLFDEVGGGIEAATYALLTDPTHAGQPPDGVDAITTEGSFRRAAFVQPVGRWSAGPVDLRGGVLFAFATAPFSEPFYTFRNGGTPTNQHDQPADGRLLGTELDWAAGLTTRNLDPSLRLELQGGHAILGPPLRGAGPGVIHLVTLCGRVRW